MTAMTTERSDGPTGRVLVINAGSSSIKFGVIEPVSGRVDIGGLVERIGEAHGRIVIRPGGAEDPVSVERPIADHTTGLTTLAETMDAFGWPIADLGIAAVGHRVVHGGPVFTTPVVVDDDVLSTIAELSSLAPLHNPPAVAGIEAAQRAFPGLVNVAVFDTAFFATLPPAASTYAIDTEVADAHGVRRYGFHGTSHRYVAYRVAAVLGRESTTLRQIVCHLGNGASVSAIRHGRAVETSMGLTPLEGLVMGTRGGDIDAGALLHLQRRAGYSVDDLDDLLNRRAGLLGLCGVSDFREVWALVEAGDECATLAFDVYVHRLRKYIGAYAAVLGGVDAITFTAGVGEHSAPLRRAVLGGWEGFGVHLDDDRNASVGGERIISTDDSAVSVLVVPTDEELAIAREVAGLVLVAEAPDHIPSAR